MSKNLERVIQRAISDAAFRRQLQSNPEAALRGFKLTDSEVAALRSGDAGKLTSLGVDQRMSKTFTFGGDSLASRSSIAGDLTTGSGASHTGGDPRMNSVGDPMSESGTASVIADSDNPPNARGYIGGQASAPTSDALEDQSHSFVASRSADVAGSARGSVIGDPDNPANARGYIGEQGASAATASNIGDPDNPANARVYIGGQAASASDTVEDQSHSFAATRSADVAASGQAAPIEGSPEEFAFRDQGATASSMADPDNPAYARGYTGGETAPTSDAIEDQSHAIAASRSDAFLSEGEVSQYSDPSLSSGQAVDEGELFNPNASDAIPDDAGTVSVRHEPDIPS